MPKQTPVMMLHADEFDDRYQQRVAELRQMSLLRERLGNHPRDVEQALAMFRQMSEHCPCPMWIKNDSFEMLAKNRAYAEIYGDATEDEYYIGRKDRAAWDARTEANYQSNDDDALKTGYHAALEPIYNAVTGRRELLWVIKWIWLLVDGTRLVVGMVVGNLPQPECARLGRTRSAD